MKVLTFWECVWRIYLLQSFLASFFTIEKLSPCYAVPFIAIKMKNVFFFLETHLVFKKRYKLAVNFCFSDTNYAFYNFTQINFIFPRDHCSEMHKQELLIP